MVRITDPTKSRDFYEALGFTFEREMDIVRNGETEATNYFFSMGDQPSVLELTYNHDGRTYDLDGSRSRASSPSGRRTRSAKAVPGSASSRIPTATGSS
jgi:catechol 2,3-dioxygenase-like lactoylglutathione lyase family enzyme